MPTLKNCKKKIPFSPKQDFALLCRFPKTLITLVLSCSKIKLVLFYQDLFCTSLVQQQPLTQKAYGIFCKEAKESKNMCST